MTPTIEPAVGGTHIVSHPDGTAELIAPAYQAPRDSLWRGWEGRVVSVVPAVLLAGADGHTALITLDELWRWQPAGHCGYCEHERRVA